MKRLNSATRFLINTVLIFLSVFTVLAFIEFTMRSAGAAFYSHQNFGNLFDQDKVDYVILCIGESTTAFGFSDSYPRILERRLAEEFPGKTIKVVNRGIPAGTTFRINHEIDQMLSRYKPDLVIAMMGINDHSIEGGELKVHWYHHLKLYSLWRYLSQSFLGGSVDVQKGDRFETLVADFPEQSELRKIVDFYRVRDFGGMLEEVERQGNPRRLLQQQTYGELLIQAYFESKRYNDLERFVSQLIDHGQSLEFLAFELANLTESDQYSNIQPALKLLTRALEDSSIGNPEKSHLLELIMQMGVFTDDRSSRDQAREVAREFQRYLKNEEYSRDLFDSLMSGEPFYGKGVLGQVYGLLETGLSRKSQREIVRKVRASGARIAVMQYPLRKVDLLIEFYEDPSIIFIENRDRFFKHIEEFGIDSVFYDRFAGDFGHSYPVGNQMIAESVVEAISPAVADDIREEKSSKGTPATIND